MRIFYLRRANVILVFLILSAMGLLYFESTGKSEDVVKALEPIYLGDTKHKAIALTINVNEGGDILPLMLDKLKENNVPATFFVTGYFAEKFPDLIMNMEAEGHEIGNHGYKHENFSPRGKRTNQKEILRTEEVLNKLIDRPARLYAPPLGECSPQLVTAADRMGYKTVMWTIDTNDWKEGVTAHDILSKVAVKAQNGAIILMHPRAVTHEALPGIIKELKAEGYQFKTVSEIIFDENSQNN
ncbi:MAG: polysaccharide deacetylase family protein [Clostridia bacterium]|nr:polysaccharide deacetylase family protein [Clostridia bacterium]